MDMHTRISEFMTARGGFLILKGDMNLVLQTFYFPSFCGSFIHLVDVIPRLEQLSPSMVRQYSQLIGNLILYWMDWIFFRRQIFSKRDPSPVHRLVLIHRESMIQSKRRWMEKSRLHVILQISFEI